MEGYSTETTQKVVVKKTKGLFDILQRVLHVYSNDSMYPNQ